MINTLKTYLIVIKYCLFLCITAVYVTSCSPNIAGGGMSIVQDFYQGEGKMLYYIRPIKFKSKKENLLIDFTYNFNQNSEDSSSLKAIFTYVGALPIKKPTSLKLLSEDSLIKNYTEFEQYYIEKKGKEWHSRYSFYMEYNDFKSFTLSKNPSIDFEWLNSTGQNNKGKFSVKGNWKKTSKTIRDKCILIVDFMSNNDL